MTTREQYRYPYPVCHSEEAVEVEVRGVGRTPYEAEVVDNCCELDDTQRNKLENDAFERALCGE